MSQKCPEKLFKVPQASTGGKSGVSVICMQIDAKRLVGLPLGVERYTGL